jgi:type I restriction enzyme S subunit
MKTKVVPFHWLVNQGHRLDCGPFVSGGIEARLTVESLACRKDRLVALTLGGIEGIYHVGQDKICWVESKEHGLPFLRSTDILMADLSGASLISKKQVEANSLFTCPEGTTLVTRSGTIGVTAYARAELARAAISQDVLKVVPDPSCVPPGYLYAYLSSRFGRPQLASGTFGSIIVHIEAENIADLPVPRLGKKIEEEAHRLMDESARCHTQVREGLSKADALLRERLSLPSPRQWQDYPRPLTATPVAQTLQDRMDAYFFCTPNRDAEAAFSSAKGVDSFALEDVADVFIPGFFKRLHVEDPQFGYPYLTGADTYALRPEVSRYLSRRVAEEKCLVVRKGMILIQDSGQLGGLIGRSVFVGEYLDGFACTNNMVRITTKDQVDAGYLFAVLASDYGTRLVTRSAAGSSIPHLDEKRMRRLCIPWAKLPTRKEVGQLVMAAHKLRDDGRRLEAEARALVERAIEGGH